MHMVVDSQLLVTPFMWGYGHHCWHRKADKRGAAELNDVRISVGESVWQGAPPGPT